MHLHNVFKALLNGSLQRGEGGVLYVKDGGCAYQFPPEFPSAEFRGALETVLEHDEGKNFFVVEEKDHQLHVLAYPKTRVWAEALSGHATSASAAEAPLSDAPIVLEDESAADAIGRSG